MRKTNITTCLAALLFSLALLGCRQQNPVIYPTLPPETPVVIPAGEGTPFVQIPTAVVVRPGSTPVAPAPAGTPGPVIEEYTVRSGDNLSSIADRFNLSLQDLMDLNGITDPNRIAIGQVLKVRITVTRVSPGARLIPDSEMVYSPAYLGFDTAAASAKFGGYLVGYSERVDGDMLAGPQIIQLVAERYSVGPRVLLALLEWQGGWVTGQPANAVQRNFPFGFQDGTKTNLYHQASLAANTLNEGYYAKIRGQTNSMVFKDRSRAMVNPQLNPGTAGLQLALGRTLNWDAFLSALGDGTGSFVETYRKLFGDPNATAIEPLVPPDVKQPSFRVPWRDGKTWYFTGGPHGGWDSGSGWAAIDFAPTDQAGTCWASADYAIAAAPGVIVRAEHGRVIESLEGSDLASPGWSLLYMHMAARERVEVGKRVEVGDMIGHPSCEGGAAETTHLHFARRYNGQWMPMDNVPLVLSGWRFDNGPQQYEGKMVRGSDTRESCNCRKQDLNSILGDNGQVNN